MPTHDPIRRRELAAFYSTHQHRLRHAVTQRAHGVDHASIEDACHTAWTILIRRPDITLDASGLAWLTTVARREAWSIAAASRREAPFGSLRGSSDTHEPAELEPLATEQPLDARLIDHCEHEPRRAALAQLKPRERQALWLQGAGYSYHEIAALTGATYTAVNRRLTEGRAALRQAA